MVSPRLSGARSTTLYLSGFLVITPTTMQSPAMSGGSGGGDGGGEGDGGGAGGAGDSGGAGGRSSVTMNWAWNGCLTESDDVHCET